MVPHVFFTWFVANLFHPLVYIIAITLFSDAQVAIPFTETVTLYFGFFFYSLVFSFPCLFAAMGLFKIISNSRLPIPLKFILWLLGCCLLVFLDFLLLMFIVEKGFYNDEMFFTLPGMAAVCLAIMIRSNCFRKFFIKPEYDKNTPK